MIGVYWYAANRLDFLSVDINHLPFTINQFFLMVFIYIYISLGYHCLVVRLICVDDPNYTAFRHWNDGHCDIGVGDPEMA